MLIEALGTVRDLSRLREIAAVLVRHGFGDLVRRLGLADALARAGHALHWEHADDLARLPPPVQVRQALEELGPTFVKLGQILAGRSDLFGPEWIAEFSRLHSRVPAVPLDALRAQLREDLGDEPERVFAHFETEPLAAASIAQVHRATLHDGTPVVLKIRRPGIVERVEADLRLLAQLAELAAEQEPALRPYRPVQLVREFARSLRREMDLATEARQAQRVAANLASLDFVVVPRLHAAYTRERLNVQDYIAGVPGDALDRLTAEGLDAKLLARRGAQAVLKMIVEDGVFHADPHPGNVVYLSGNRIAFLDFGMVGTLSPRRREDLLRLLLGLTQQDASAVADVLMDWTGNGHGTSQEALEADIAAFVETYHGVPLAQLSLAQMLADVTALLREHRLALPSDLALLVKAFISLEGMGRGLDPDFHMAAEALPLLQRTVRARYRPKALLQRSLGQARDTLRLLEQAPRDLGRLLRRIRRGEARVGVDITHLQQVGDQIDRSASRLAMALVIAALIIGSSIAMTVEGGPTLLGLPLFGLLGFLGAVGGGLWLLGSIRREQREARRHRRLDLDG